MFNFDSFPFKLSGKTGEFKVNCVKIKNKIFGFAQFFCA